MDNDVSDYQIQRLRFEAADAGDERQVEMCDAALDGDDGAREACAAAIADTEVNP